jgi:hypothetical protein
MFMYYGGRGITVCDEWSTSFMAFNNWAMSNGYHKDLTLDRRDGDRGYEPENCRWATRTQQMGNTRKRRNAKTSIFKGVSKHSQNRSWIAQGYKNGRSINLGSFRGELAAALEYDRWARIHFGEFARINFPERKEA